jgi:tungstate transport system ATP-binding protein
MNEPLSVLGVKNLRVKREGVLQLDIPVLAIDEGKTLSLIGPNGAGKTTLLQTLSFLVKSFTGEIFFKGEKVSSHRSILEYRRRLAMVFQEPLLFDTTVFNNVASGLRIRGMKRSVVRSTVMEHLAWFGIDHLAKRSGRTLSGGEAQRTSLARAFATQPEVLLLDEPFASLDPPTRESLVEDLQRILRRTKTTAIVATHDRLEALQLSDQIAVMNNGTIVQIGPPEEVMNHPANEFVASFVGVETVLAGKVIDRDEGTFTTSVSGQRIEAVGKADIGESVILCIRPENVTLSIDPRGETTSARNVFSGKIERIFSIGLYRKIQLDCGFRIVAYVTHHSTEALSLCEGKDVTVSFKATAVHVMRTKE